MKNVVFALAATALSTTASAQDTTTIIKKEEGILGSKTPIEQMREPSTYILEDRHNRFERWLHDRNDAEDGRVRRHDPRRKPSAECRSPTSKGPG